MLRKAFYIGMIVYSGLKFLRSIDNYHSTRRAGKKKEFKEALQVWEGEGGNPQGVRPPTAQRVA